MIAKCSQIIHECLNHIEQQYNAFFFFFCFFTLVSIAAFCGVAMVVVVVCVRACVPVFVCASV